MRGIQKTGLPSSTKRLPVERNHPASKLLGTIIDPMLKKEHLENNLNILNDLKRIGFKNSGINTANLSLNNLASVLSESILEKDTSQNQNFKKHLVELIWHLDEFLTQKNSRELLRQEDFELLSQKIFYELEQSSKGLDYDDAIKFKSYLIYFLAISKEKASLNTDLSDRSKNDLSKTFGKMMLALLKNTNYKKVISELNDIIIITHKQLESSSKVIVEKQLRDPDKIDLSTIMQASYLGLTRTLNSSIEDAHKYLTQDNFETHPNFETHLDHEFSKNFYNPDLYKNFNPEEEDLGSKKQESFHEKEFNKIYYAFAKQETPQNPNQENAWSDPFNFCLQNIEKHNPILVFDPSFALDNASFSRELNNNLYTKVQEKAQKFLLELLNKTASTENETSSIKRIVFDSRTFSRLYPSKQINNDLKALSNGALEIILQEYLEDSNKLKFHEFIQQDKIQKDYPLQNFSQVLFSERSLEQIRSLDALKETINKHNLKIIIKNGVSSKWSESRLNPDNERTLLIGKQQGDFDQVPQEIIFNFANKQSEPRVLLDFQKNYATDKQKLNNLLASLKFTRARNSLNWGNEDNIAALRLVDNPELLKALSSSKLFTTDFHKHLAKLERNIFITLFDKPPSEDGDRKKRFKSISPESKRLLKVS